MILLGLAILGLAIAAVSAALFIDNVRLFRRAPSQHGAPPVHGRVSVLVPARNEEAAIAACVRSVLTNQGVDLEAIVLDDGSTDRTAAEVRAIAAVDPRVRVDRAPPLPSGWCGKQHACHVLAQRASGDWLIFIDADVRLAPDAIARAIAFAQSSGAALVSGFPRQETGSILERMLIPLIHFVLLGFLPMRPMRHSTSPAYGAGCGQFFVARRNAYEAAGGHASIRRSLHDGVTLPRAFRQQGFLTDVFDATDTATCRMYRSSAETWRGLAKNASEGMAQPVAIVCWTMLLGIGHVLPPVLLLVALASDSLSHRSAILACTIPAAALAYVVRGVAALRYRQPPLVTLLHPVSVGVLLTLQWVALLGRSLGHVPTWRGRSYGAATAAS